MLGENISHSVVVMEVCLQLFVKLRLSRQEFLRAPPRHLRAPPRSKASYRIASSRGGQMAGGSTLGRNEMLARFLTLVSTWKIPQHLLNGEGAEDARRCAKGVGVASRVEGSLGAPRSPRWSRLFEEPSVLPELRQIMRISGTTNSITTEVARRALRGNLTCESPDTPSRTSHIPS
jgi:hypothetical protein